MRVHLDIPYIEKASNMQLLDMYLPDEDGFNTIIWFHGGGLENGNRKDVYLAEPFLKKGIGFISVEYRMYPDAYFTDFIQDAASAVSYITKNISQYGGSEKIYIMGESAGAYIAMILCMDHHYLTDVGVSQQQITGYISDSAQQFCHFNVLRELGIDSRLERIDHHAPIYFIKEGLQTRPLLLIYYEEDIPCRSEETILFYTSFKRIIPGNRIYIEQLPGTHCSRPVNEKGELILFQKAFEFITVLDNDGRKN